MPVEVARSLRSLGHMAILHALRGLEALQTDMPCWTLAWQPRCGSSSLGFSGLVGSQPRQQPQQLESWWSQVPLIISRADPCEALSKRQAAA